MTTILFAAHTAWAVDPSVHITQYAHTAWRIQDGYFAGAPTAIAQTTDGYLWIGTATGLFRFDGVRFVAWTELAHQKQLESARVTALLGARDGSLWIGAAVRFFRWKDNALSEYSAGDEIVSSIVESPNGAIWLTRENQVPQVGALCQVQDRGLHCFGPRDGIPDHYGVSLAEDATGALWIGGPDDLIRWRSGLATVWTLKALQDVKGLEGFSAVAVDRDNSLWVGIKYPGAELGLEQFRDGIWKPFISSQLNGASLSVSKLLLDRDGALWVGTEDHGIYRLIDGKADHFDSADGLSGDTVTSLFQDHEGTIWVATSKGVDSFRDLPIVSISKREGLHSDGAQSILSSKDGTIWIGNVGSLDAWRDGAVTSILPKDGLPGREVTSLLQDSAGRLWVGIDDGLFRLEGGKFVRVNVSGEPGPLTTLISGADGSAWALNGRTDDLVRIKNGQVVERHALITKVILTVALARQGDIWVAGDTLGYLRDSAVTTISEFGPRYGYIRAIAVDSDGFAWFGATKGLVGIIDGKLQEITTANGLPCGRINALIFDNHHSLWLHAQCGLIRIEHGELKKWRRHPDGQVKTTMFDVLDGFQGGPSAFRPAATKSSDGRLWFINSSVVQTINPDHVSVNHLAPPVHIEQAIADAKNYSLENVIHFPKLSRNIEIKYTALSFVVPQRVLFRYKLDGYDTDWQEAGTRRSAFYTNLRPGRYKFHVIACNNDGVWNESGAAVDLVIAPAFYQTIWFQVLLGLIGIGLICLLHLFRLRQATARVRARLEDRLEERGRIARELHDTLIQSVDGLMLYLQAAIDEPDRERSHRMLEKALDRADDALSEGRERVQTLRTEALSANDLSQSLTDYGEERAQDHAMQFSVTLVGNSRPLDPIVRDEAFRIGREALANAFQHSGASKIEVELTYNRAEIRLRIRDDGSGIDARILETGKPGHWGLSGMRERANRVGADLNIWSRPNAGTEIDITIPARAAYQRHFRIFPLFFNGRKAGGGRSPQ